ncbi:L2 [Tursiops truncatus papillomavirus 1]|uniref:Minor capsid protein L2 n=1 Tax=Tursiops truncatus papillomavirus 1 TaxID=936059 RepID=B4XYE5_9PAPI|nr:L2 [Tursiops truncatus papillomavirus 1]ABY73449.1 L2 [Tursiops truncatus papillomavirus 1]
MRARRVPRAAAEDLYKTCRTGDCLPDVKAQFEQDTVADKILKWLSSFVYFGGLGISSAKGGGGRLPSAQPSPSRLPVGGRAVLGPGRTVPVLPSASIPIDVIGPADVGPVLESVPAVIDASSPSVVTLSEGTGVSGGTDLTRFSEVFPGTSSESPAVLDIDLTDFGPRTRGDTFATESDLAVISSREPKVPSYTASSIHINPTYEPTIFTTGSTPLLGEGTSSENVYILTDIAGQQIGPPNEASFENIELQDIPSTSTPKSPLRGVTSPGRRSSLLKGRSIWSRRGLPFRLRPAPAPTDLDFLVQPHRYIDLETLNPAYDPEGSLVLPGEPESAFPSDLQSLSRPEFTVHNQHIRLNRIGQRASLHLRSGTIVGTNVHFYSELSSIHAEEGIELSLLGSHTGDSTVVNPQAANITIAEGPASAHIIDPMSTFDLFSDSELLDSLSEDFGHGVLVVGSGNRRPIHISMPEVPVSRKFYAETFSGLYVHHPIYTGPPVSSDWAVPAVVDISPTPDVVIYSTDDFGYMFRFWHFLRRRRKRRYL